MKQYLLGLYEKSMPNTLPPVEKLRHTAAAGYDYLELSIDETDEKLARLDWGRADIAALCAAQAETGVPVKSMCLSAHRRFPLGHPDAAVRAKSLDVMQKAVRLAVLLGVRIVQIAGYDVYYEPSTAETGKWFAENLRRSVEMAAREGVLLAFETMETDFLNTVQKAMVWVEEINSPYLQVYPDIGNLTNACGSGAPADLARGAGHVCAVHLKETRPGVYREVPYGEGHVNFAAMTDAAWQAGARMYVGEFWHTGENNWQATLQANRVFLRGALDRACEKNI